MDAGWAELQEAAVPAAGRDRKAPENQDVLCEPAMHKQHKLHKHIYDIPDCHAADLKLD